MRRGVVIGLSVIGALCVLLAVAVARVGTQLDQARIERDDLQFEVEDLRNESQSLKAERDTLKRQVNDKLKTIEQMKTEAEKFQNPPASTPSNASQPNPSDQIPSGTTSTTGSSQ